MILCQPITCFREATGAPLRINAGKQQQAGRRLKKLLLVMKLTAIFLLAACMQVSAKGYSQRVSLSVKDEPLENVMQQIKDQTGYSFFYNADWLQKSKVVTIDLKQAGLHDALDLIFKDQPLDYSIIGNTIVLKLKEKTTPVITDDSEAENIPPPPTDITGRITNEQGEPLSGASVIIKRTGRGDIADAQGDFHLKDVTNDDYIIISFAGYKTQTIKVGSITKFTIVMQVTDNDLDKVVIQAYGTTTQRLATGDIATVKAEQIERQPVMNALTALEGQVPGLVVQQNNGYASSPFKIELRGRSVLDPNSPPSEPLYIIDGVPITVLNLAGANYGGGGYGITQNGLTGPAGGQSPFFSINPQDIESISVLKDADATAIYGSRGANGVIIITTKSGHPGKTNIDVNVYQGSSNVTGRYSLLNTQQYLAMRREAFKNDGVAMNTGNAYDLLSWDTTRNSDWQNILWGQTGHTIDAELGLSGGDKQNTFRIGGGYHKETSILSRSGADQRGTIDFSYVHHSLNQRLTLSFKNLYSYTKSDLIYLNSAVLTTPDAPSVLDSRGYLNWTGWQPSFALYSFTSLFQPYNSKTGLLNSQLNLQYDLTKGLTFSTQLGYSTYHNSQTYLTPIISQNPAFNPTGSSEFGNNNGSNIIVEPQIEYKKLISKGNLSALLGASTQIVTNDGNTITGSGYINDNLLLSANNAPNRNGSSSYGQYKYAAIFARINYNWNGKYLLNFSTRRDGSSRFGPGKQYGNFGAIGVGWIFTDESWAKKILPFLSYGKLRVSYGLTGYDGINDYGYLTRWSANSFPYQGIPSYLPLQHANPDLEWQTNRKLEAAIDLGFLDDRLSIDVAFYRNRCGNQLIRYQLPILTGFNNVSANFPATIQNSGLEIVLKGKIIENTNFSWSNVFNIGINKNKLIAFPNLAQSSYASQFNIGQSLSIIRLLHFTGVDPETGQYTYEDKNHNGNLDYSYNNGNNDLFDKDLAVKFDGSLESDFRFKSLQLNVLFAFRDVESPSAVYSFIPGSIGNNQSTQVLDHWQKPGDKAKFARFTTQPTSSDYYFASSDAIYSNGSYIRLRNISVSYDLPNRWVKKIKLSQCRIYARAENLFVLTRYNGVDPEATSLGALPPVKIITSGVQLNL